LINKVIAPLKRKYGNHFIVSLLLILLIENSIPVDYTVLTILTDGAINDEKETIQSVIEASKLPISIIIIGIGNSFFGTMEGLDADVSQT
jgi:hypothetical protein